MKKEDISDLDSAEIDLLFLLKECQSKYYKFLSSINGDLTPKQYVWLTEWYKLTEKLLPLIKNQADDDLIYEIPIEKAINKVNLDVIEEEMEQVRNGFENINGGQAIIQKIYLRLILQQALKKDAFSKSQAST
ncbi:hypothetical protein [Prochlorococcus marinus]|uniref:Uncharacterized protein n=1 Tax=Prochlorococcus marinus str. PAC1 TaxID=59924 RepID=A0A0A2BYW5_PROMR|nr:hypothetical protein [Prochlorococcus marinus]KGG19286.1 hypothetical protein EV03_1666 [Prochlorococcus marinus str. PAC1]